MASRWLIPEDGIIDDVAVELAVRGRRGVRLTPLERSLAAALILATGGSDDDLCQRLHVSKRDAVKLGQQARRIDAIADDAETEFPPLVVPAAS